MAERTLRTLFGIALACALVAAEAPAQTPGELQFDRLTAFLAAPSTCSTPQRIVVPRAVAERARLKVRLANLLRESLYDDAKGIVNVAREKEIKKLANKLKKEN